MSTKLLQHNNLGNLENIKELLLDVLESDEYNPFVTSKDGPGSIVNLWGSLFYISWIVFIWIIVIVKVIS